MLIIRELLLLVECCCWCCYYCCFSITMVDKALQLLWINVSPIAIHLCTSGQWPFRVEHCSWWHFWKNKNRKLIQKNSNISDAFPKPEQYTICCHWPLTVQWAPFFLILWNNDLQLYFLISQDFLFSNQPLKKEPDNSYLHCLCRVPEPIAKIMLCSIWCTQLLQICEELFHVRSWDLRAFLLRIIWNRFCAHSLLNMWKFKMAVIESLIAIK